MHSIKYLAQYLSNEWLSGEQLFPFEEMTDLFLIAQPWLSLTG